MAGRSLQITYLGDAKSVLAAQKQIDAGHSKMQGGATKTGGTLKNVFGSIIPGATFLTVAGIGLAAKAIVNAATTEIEAQNQVNVIFGKSVDVVNRFAEQSATSAGISKGAALEAAGGFGAMLKSAGLAADEAANLSVNVVQLAGDLASFKNVAPEEALEKLRSGLAGEAEPLRQFGVFLSEAAVQAEAYKSGIATVGSELTEAQKVQARYNIILDQTTDAQGDFANTLGESLPNQLRALRAQVTDLAADLGKLLVPVLLHLTQLFGFLVDNLPAVVAGFVAFAAIQFLPGLLFNVALGLEAIGAARVASGVLSVATALGGLGPAGLVAATAVISVAAAMKVLNGEPPTFAEELGGALADAAIKTGVLEEGLGLTSGEMDVLARHTDDSTNATNRHARASELLTEELRDQRLATLALTDSFLGIASQADAVAEAQRELNRLEQKGKEDTKAYEQAVLDALEAQIGLEDAVFSYAQELADSGETQKEVERKVRDLGREFGLTKGDLADLIERLRDYIDDLNRIPSNVTTNVVTNYGAHGNPAGFAAQHGGIVTRPTVALIGEAGPEAVVPLSRAPGASRLGGGVTVHVHIGNVVGPGGVEEVAGILIREFQKHGIRNVTAGIP